MASLYATLRPVVPGNADEGQGRVDADNLAAALRGPIGLALFLTYASEAARLPPDAAVHVEHSAAIILDSAVRDCLRLYYGVLDEYDLDNCHLHRIGTTSVILACTSTDPHDSGRPRRIALKCLLPRYLGVQAIRERTEGYMREHQLTESTVVPWVYGSTQSWIALEFIDGDTLAERLERDPAPTRRAFASDEAFVKARLEYAAERRLKKADVVAVRRYGLAVLTAMSQLSAHHRHHGDLSPTNIIVVSREASTDVEVRLIDLGESYAIAERVGSSEAIARASLYVAPELMKDRAHADWRCDLYSLGIIMLEAAAKRPIRKEDVDTELDRLWRGERGGRVPGQRMRIRRAAKKSAAERDWDGVPGYARIIEDLVDEDPARRLVLCSDKTQAGAYEYLSRLLRQESQVLDLYEENTSSEAPGFGVLRGFNLIRFWNNEQLKNRFQALHHIDDPVDDEYGAFPRLARWPPSPSRCGPFHSQRL